MHTFCQIQHAFTCGIVLWKLSKEYLNALTCKFYTFYRQNSETFDILHAFLSQSYQLLKTVCFLAHAVHILECPKHIKLQFSSIIVVLHD